MTTDSRQLLGAGIPPLPAEVLGDTPAVVVATGTTQAAAQRLNTRCASINAQTSQTGVYIAPATAASLPFKLLYSPYFLNYSTLSAANPVIYVGLGAYLNGTLNGAMTLTNGQSAIIWQQIGGVFYGIKNAS